MAALDGHLKWILIEIVAIDVYCGDLFSLGQQRAHKFLLDTYHMAVASVLRCRFIHRVIKMPLLKTTKCVSILTLNAQQMWNSSLKALLLFF